MKKKYIRIIIKEKNKSVTPDITSHNGSKKLESAFSYASLSDKGLHRSTNQDSYGVFPKNQSTFLGPKGKLFIVADGMGGHIGGREASEMAVDFVQQIYFADKSEEISQSLLRAFGSANMQIFQKASCDEPLQNTGTTCTALVLTKDRAYIAHIGDSRIYRIHMNKIKQLTRDHTEVAEMLREGGLSKDEAQNHPERSILSRALGVEPNVKIDIQRDIPLRSDDCYVLCTDGLANIPHEEIKDIVLSNSTEEACRSLVQLANHRGGEDNVTVQVIRIN